jgi:hypothetical protein
MVSSNIITCTAKTKKKQKHFNNNLICIGDSGQLLASVCTAGVPRAPGYPLFALAARLVIYLIPFGTPAWRVAVLCSFFGALASHYVYKTVKLYPIK